MQMSFLNACNPSILFNWCIESDIGPQRTHPIHTLTRYAEATGYCARMYYFKWACICYTLSH